MAAGGWCHGFHCATLDPVRITSWWTRDPRFGVGVATGPAGLVVLDVDAHAAHAPERDRLLPGIPIPDQVDLDGLASGYDTLALLAAYRGQPNPAHDVSTLRVRTPSGGLHIWYEAPPTLGRCRSSTGSSPRTALAWQVDVRAHGGYIVAPATTTPKGTYAPVAGARLPAPLPDWIAAELRRTDHIARKAVPVPLAPRHTAPLRRRTAAGTLRPLLDQVEACASTPEGASFSEKLNRAAWTAGGLVSAGHIGEQVARDLLFQAARLARPKQERRNGTIIESALRAGAVRPFHPKDSHE